MSPPVLSYMIFCLSLCYSLYRALSCAGTAVNAGIGIDLVLSISLRDSSYGANLRTASALYTCIRNLICHDCNLLDTSIY